MNANGAWNDSEGPPRIQTRRATRAMKHWTSSSTRTGDFAGAKRCHRRAARLATESPDEARFNLGLILRAERRYEEAIACFDRAIQHDPKYKIAFEARRDCVRALALLHDRGGTSSRAPR